MMNLSKKLLLGTALGMHLMATVAMAQPGGAGEEDHTTPTQPVSAATAPTEDAALQAAIEESRRDVTPEDVALQAAIEASRGDVVPEEADLEAALEASRRDVAHEYAALQAAIEASRGDVAPDSVLAALPAASHAHSSDASDATGPMSPEEISALATSLAASLEGARSTAPYTAGGDAAVVDPSDTGRGEGHGFGPAASAVASAPAGDATTTTLAADSDEDDVRAPIPARQANLLAWHFGVDDTSAIDEVLESFAGDSTLEAYCSRIKNAWMVVDPAMREEFISNLGAAASSATATEMAPILASLAASFESQAAPFISSLEAATQETAARHAAQAAEYAEYDAMMRNYGATVEDGPLLQEALAASMLEEEGEFLARIAQAEAEAQTRREAHRARAETRATAEQDSKEPVEEKESKGDEEEGTVRAAASAPLVAASAPMAVDFSRLDESQVGSIVSLALRSSPETDVTRYFKARCLELAGKEHEGEHLSLEVENKDVLDALARQTARYLSQEASRIHAGAFRPLATALRNLSEGNLSAVNLEALPGASL